MLLQSYDYLELSRRYGCRLQIGGSDQWGNITAGCELIRRVDGGRGRRADAAAGDEGGRREVRQVGGRRDLPRPGDDARRSPSTSSGCSRTMPTRAVPARVLVPLARARSRSSTAPPPSGRTSAPRSARWPPS